MKESTEDNNGEPESETDTESDTSMLTLEGDKLEAIEIHMEDAIKKQENAIKNWVKLGLRI